MKISVIIPAYLSSDILLDFTKQTLESIQSKNHEISVYLIVTHAEPQYYPSKDDFNLHESIKEFHVLDNPKGNEVGAAWNFGIKTALEAGNEYVMVMNNDLILHPDCFDNLVAFATEHQEFILWSAAEWVDFRSIKTRNPVDFGTHFDEHPHFSFFMVNQKTVDTIGWFDENLKMAYMEDGDFHVRILLSGNKAARTESARFYHYGSRTIKTDDELYDKNKRSYEDNRSYIWLKWHVDFHGKVFNPPEEVLKECYKYPFNNASKSVKDC